MGRKVFIAGNSLWTVLLISRLCYIPINPLSSDLPKCMSSSTTTIIISSCLSNSYITFTKPHPSSAEIYTMKIDEPLSLYLHLFDHNGNQVNATSLNFLLSLTNIKTNYTTTTQLNPTDIHTLHAYEDGYELTFPMLTAGVYDVHVLIDYYTVC